MLCRSGSYRETESEILRSACRVFMEDALRPSVRGRKGVGNRTEQQEKLKGNGISMESADP